LFIWQVSYRLGEDSNLGSKFRVEPTSGEICLASALDHEQESAYDLTVVAVDRVSNQSKIE
jgi:protocadherin-16/23